MVINEVDILERWKTLGFIFVLKEDLNEILKILAKNNFGSVVVDSHGDDWIIRRIY